MLNCSKAPSPGWGGLGWGTVLMLFNRGEIKDEPSFRTCFGIARLKSISTTLATLKLVQGDEKL